MRYYGELMALITAFCWTGTAIAFEFAGKRIGSLSMNFIRLIIAFIFYVAYSAIMCGSVFPVGFSLESWGWLALSGLVGFVIGDFFLFQAFVDIGARTALVIMSMWPAIAALLAWLFLGEKMSLLDWSGLIMVTTGIVIVISSSKDGRVKRKSKKKLSMPVRGVFLAFGGAVGQAVGMVFSKIGMMDQDAFSASYIRVIAATIGFALLFTFTKRWQKLFTAFKDVKAVSITSLGAFGGPFLGVSFSLMAIQYTATGVASTIMAINPILIIPLSVIFFKEKVTWKEVAGAIISVTGVMMFFI